VVLVQRLKGDTAYSQEQVEDLLGHKLAGIVSPATGIVREALERGEPAVLSHPAAEISEQIRNLTQSLLA
jgi:hypothetical protein